MKTVADRIRENAEREEKERRMGGEKGIAKQHDGGKLTARERLELLFDEGSFSETDMFVRHRCVDFGMPDVEVPGDGVVTGHGLIDGRKAFAYSQDFTARAGTMGEMQSKKICKVMDLALKTGSPIVGLNDSGGARIQEGVDALSGYGQIFYRNSVASGVPPSGRTCAVSRPASGEPARGFECWCCPRTSHCRPTTWCPMCLRMYDSSMYHPYVINSYELSHGTCNGNVRL